jgi:hypothetical protein
MAIDWTLLHRWICLNLDERLSRILCFYQLPPQLLCSNRFLQVLTASSMEIVSDDDDTANLPRILTSSPRMNRLLPLLCLTPRSSRSKAQWMEDEIQEDEKMEDEEQSSLVDT